MTKSPPRKEEDIMAVRHVTTIAELKAAFDYYPSCPESLTVEIDNDLDFNDSSYYRYDGDFFYLGQGNQQFTINGNGHTLANIYLFPNRALIDYNTYSRGEKPVINDLKFEIVSNNATIIRHHNYISFQGETMAQWMINRCTFNVKVYSAVNPLFAFETLSGGGNNTFGFVNCVFNLYISGINVNQTIDDRNMDFYWAIVLFFHGNYFYSYEGCCILSGCMFNIRNATNKFIMFVKTSGNPDSARVVFDNNAIFYSDIGLEQPPYNQGETLQPFGPIGGAFKQHYIFTKGTANTTMVQNCYIAQFDQYKNLNPDFEKPVFGFFHTTTGDSESTVSSKINTSFYDKDKINAFQIYKEQEYNGNVWINRVDNLNGVLSALTTSQCKDAIALGSVGYIFSQEV